ncbi:hypothetical protein NEUTE2DRAFT_127091 [Neurospora tetrasperma FGSC 2509]|nr:hypothetical protein NEUTE2DRAFT_127091 [Neurospora tetrasperma FGSC 2509]
MYRIISGNPDSTSTVGISESFDRQSHASMFLKVVMYHRPTDRHKETNSDVKRSANATQRKHARWKMQDARCKIRAGRLIGRSINRSVGESLYRRLSPSITYGSHSGPFGGCYLPRKQLCTVPTCCPRVDQSHTSR